MNADGTGETALTNDVVAEGSPAWSPDGTKIAFTKFGSGSNYDTYVMDANGANQLQLTTAAETDTVADWQPLLAAVGGTTLLSNVHLPSSSSGGPTLLGLAALAFAAAVVSGIVRWIDAKAVANTTPER
jgi:hypothetical protein